MIGRQGALKSFFAVIISFSRARYLIIAMRDAQLLQIIAAVGSQGQVHDMRGPVSCAIPHL
jgi:hypothetical protein